MARIQVLPLPTEKVGEMEHTPFVLILDQFALDEAWEQEYSDQLRQQTGATTVLAYEGTIDAPGALNLSDDEKTALATFLLKPRQWISEQRYTDQEPHLIPGPVMSTPTT